MAEHQLPKLNTGVRFPSPAPYCGGKKDVSCEKTEYIGLFCYPNGDFSLQKHRCKIAVFPLWIDLNSRKVNIRYTGR